VRVLLRARLAEEFTLRQLRNPRYSLRSFARDLAVHHATLSRVLRGARAEKQTIAAVARRLKLTDAEVDACIAAEHVAAVSRAIARHDFHPDSRWLSVVSGVPLDHVNVALQRLLQSRRLHMISRHEWCLEGVPR
jgi:hypothetical protein